MWHLSASRVVAGPFQCDVDFDLAAALPPDPTHNGSEAPAIQAWRQAQPEFATAGDGSQGNVQI